MERGKLFIKGGCFLAVVALVVAMVNSILTPKYLYGNVFPTSQTYIDFYDMKKDSVDVLFLGSSHSVNAFSPLELYKDYRITSYNLGGEQQNLVVSYYWLKEALRYQSPQVVVLDTYFMYSYVEKKSDGLNSEEFAVRKALDYMKWSPVKMEAIEAVSEIDGEHDKWSYYFPNIRYHSRWSSLEESDLTPISVSKGLMGFSPMNYYAYENGLDFWVLYQPYENVVVEDVLPPLDIMQEYLDKIVDLCKEEGIELILCKTPTSTTSVYKYNYMKQYAESKEIAYIDFNEKSVYDAMEYDVLMDNNDLGHVNFLGMQKICEYLGPILVDDYKVQQKEDKQYENRLEHYVNTVEDSGLRMVTDIYEYLNRINDERYVVFISINGDGAMALNPEVMERLSDLGCTVDFSQVVQQSYLFVKDGETCIENVSQEQIEDTGTIRNGKTVYSISSAGDYAGKSSSIIIDGKDYAKNARGMNVVVYSLEQKKVIDSVCFTTYVSIDVQR